MKVWLLTAVVAVFFLKDTNATCSNNPCPVTDYRSYSSCLSRQCPNTVVATGCESKCSSVDCDTCVSSSSCCQSCCRNKCECSSLNCDTCSSSSSSACCKTCCPKQDCCTSKRREDCCVEPTKDKPVPPTVPPITYPPITLPNITIVINQSAPIFYNTLNQSCGGVTTTRNSTHIVTTTETCSNHSTPNQPCCIITQQPQCPYPFPLFNNCPPPVQNYACGPQCFVRPQVLIPPPPQVIQPIIPPPPPVFVQPPPPPPPPPVTRCYQYPSNMCPQQCVGIGGCLPPRQIGCYPLQQWPFVRCGYGLQYANAIGGIGGYGGYVGQGDYTVQGGYGGYSSGPQPYIG